MAARTKSLPLTGEVLTAADEAERQKQILEGRAMAMHDDFMNEEPDPDDVALQNVLAELGSSGADAKVHVYQIDDKKNRAFVGSFLPGDFSIETLQAQFGPGDYSVEVRKDKKWLKKSVIKIAAPRIPLGLPVPAAPAESAKLVETMQAGFMEMGKMFSDALGRLAQNQAPQKSNMDMLNEMIAMKNLLGMDRPTPQGPDMMQVLELASNLAEKIHPREGEPGTMEVIMEAMKNFGPMFNKIATAQHVQTPVPGLSGPAVPPQVAPMNQSMQSNPQGPQAPQTAPENPPQTQGEDMNVIARKMFLNLLIANANAGNDTEPYANMVLDTVGEADAVAFVNTPDWFERLCAEEPRATNFRPWFEQLRADVLELTKPEDEGINKTDAPIAPPAPA